MSITFVTAFFRLRDRVVDEHEQFTQFDALARSGVSIILFLDERYVGISPWGANVRVVPQRLDDLLFFKQAANSDSEAKGRSLDLPVHRNPEKDTREFLLLQNSKIEFLYEASQIDDSNSFAWIDFGILKIARDPERFIEKLKLLPEPTDVSTPGCWTLEQSRTADPESVNWRFCGGFIAMQRNAIDRLAQFIRLKVGSELKSGLHPNSQQQQASPDRLTWEVNNWAHFESYWNFDFGWYKADHDDSIIDIPPTQPQIDRSLALSLVSREARVCLNMIVKNESRVIERCLESALPYIDTWCITDTGSTDGTPELIQSFFKKHRVPGSVCFEDFVNYAQARNASLNFARARGGWDYALLIDADMRLEGTFDKTSLTAPAYKIIQRNGSIDYSNTRLVRSDSNAFYVGVTHEYISVEGVEELEGFVIDDRDDGGNKPEKADRDIRLLTEGLITEPENGRYMFYLAQTYRGIGRHEESIKWYRRRIMAGGWDEEVWYSRYAIAHAYKELGNEPEFVKACLEAYDFRPSRGEPLKLLAQFYREHGKNDAACLVAEALYVLGYPEDELFVERDVYDFGAKQELAIAGFYSKDPRRRGAAREACAALTLHAYGHVREEARRNLTYYARSVNELFGAETRSIEWQPGGGWAPMNPSVCIDGERRLVLVRTVNYVVADGQYPTIDGSGVIRTRNHVLEMNSDWQPTTSTLVQDITGDRRNDFPVEGYEDCRLWCGRTSYFASATVRDLADNPSGHCEMSILRFDDDWRIVAARPIRDYEHHRTQKNWMPITTKRELFVYSCDPTIVIDPSAATAPTFEVASNSPKGCLVDLRGGSQLIPHGGGWLCITHEVAWRPERVYLHRFVRLGPSFDILFVSEPFYFAHIGIEFCAGLARDGNRLVASFGVNDASAHLAFFDPVAIDRALYPL